MLVRNYNQPMLGVGNSENNFPELTSCIAKPTQQQPFGNKGSRMTNTVYQTT